MQTGIADTAFEAALMAAWIAVVTPHGQSSAAWLYPDSLRFVNVYVASLQQCEFEFALSGLSSFLRPVCAINPELT